MQGFPPIRRRIAPDIGRSGIWLGRRMAPDGTGSFFRPHVCFDWDAGRDLTEFSKPEEFFFQFFIIGFFLPTSFNSEVNFSTFS